MSLLCQVQQIQQELALLALKAQNPKADQLLIRAQAQALQNQLLALRPQIAKAQHELAAIETQVKELQADQAQLAGQTDGLMEAWVHHCDVLGRLGPATHSKSLPFFDQLVADEPRLWQLYLARGVARFHAGLSNQATADLERVESKLRLYDSRPRPLALVTAVEAYTLCKQQNTRDGDNLFMEAKKIDKQCWAVCLIRGWSNLERKKYSLAKSDFQMALRLSKKLAGRAARGDGTAAGRLPN